MKDYLKTLSMRLSPTSNYTYADADGNILYLWNARIPKRVQDGTDYALDVPGDTKKYVWKKLHPTKDLPQLLNPARRLHPERQQPALVRLPEGAARPGPLPRLLRARRAGAAAAACRGDAGIAREVLGRGREATEVRDPAAAGRARDARPPRGYRGGGRSRARSRGGPPRARSVGCPGVGDEPRCGSVRSVLGHLSRRRAAAVRRGVGRGASLRDAARDRQSTGRARSPGGRGSMDTRHVRRGGCCLGRREPVSVRRPGPAR